jgi:hypothetical protein
MRYGATQPRIQRISEAVFPGGTVTYCDANRLRLSGAGIRNACNCFHFSHPTPYVFVIALYAIVVPCYLAEFRHSALCQISQSKKPNATPIEGNKLDHILRYEITYIILGTCVWAWIFRILHHTIRFILTVKLTVRLIGNFSTQYEGPYIGHILRQFCSPSFLLLIHFCVSRLLPSLLSGLFARNYFRKFCYICCLGIGTICLARKKFDDFISTESDKPAETTEIRREKLRQTFLSTISYQVTVTCGFHRIKRSCLITLQVNYRSLCVCVCVYIFCGAAAQLGHRPPRCSGL